MKHFYLLFLFSASHFLQLSDAEARQNILGLQRTSPEVVRSFLWPEGNEEQKAKLTDIQDLQNLGVFPSVKENENEDIEVTESWTTIPIIKASAGGGVNYLTLGVFDPNSFGQLLELGAQYESLAGRDSGVIWFRKPRLFGRTSLGGDIWSSQRLRLLTDASGNQRSGFVTERQRYNLFIENRLLPNLWIGAGLDYNRDSISTEDFDMEFQNQFQEFFDPQYLNGDREKLWARIYARIGRLNESIPFLEGQAIEVNLRATNGDVASVSNITEASIQGLFFERWGNHNAGLRLRWDVTSSKFPEDRIYVGGFDRVRGFQDGQFFGQNAVVANLEHRYQFFKLKSRWLALQSVAFADIGHTQGRGDAFASVGGGLRFISPRIYRFNARLDFAKVINGAPGPSLSFGIQQFF